MQYRSSVVECISRYLRRLVIGVSLALGAFGLGLVGPGAGVMPGSAATTIPFGYTGGPQTFTVPMGITSITVDALGAQGSDGDTSSPPGLGGEAKSTLAVTPLEVMQVNVGGRGGVNKGGFNGGGDGGGAGQVPGGGGGGASDIRSGAFGPTDRVVVAGGGGGGGGFVGQTGPGGGGGGASGGNGGDSGFGTTKGGKGGANGIGGAGGAGNGASGGDGSSTTGGPGGDEFAGGGGGGGGYGGGGGGGASCLGCGQGGMGGGGGGLALGTATSLATGIHSGNGAVTITYIPSVTVTTPSSGSIALGGSNSDRATVTGIAAGGSPTGTVSFFVCGPLSSPAGCPSGGAAVGSAVTLNAQSGNTATATSDDFTPSAVGIWCFRGAYSGDTNYDASSDISASECFTVKASTSLATTASPGVAVGGKVHDSAGLSNGFNPTGTITFNLYGPNDASCGNAAVFNAQVSVNAGNGSYGSGDFTTAAAGTYRWTAAYSGDSNNAPSSTACNDANESLVVSSASDITATGTSFNAREGRSRSGKVAAFTDSGSTELATSFSAAIDWGDSTSSAGAVSGSAGSYTVTASHIYADEGQFTVSVVIKEIDGDNPAPTATATGTATVAEADRLTTASARNFSSRHGVAFSRVLATFTDAVSNVPGDFTVRITWGDGSPASAGTVTGSGTNFRVSGTHTYARAGTFTVTVTFTDGSPGTARATAGLTATVS